MTNITIDTDNDSDLKLLQILAQKNGWEISYAKDSLELLKKSNKEKNKRLIYIMEEFAKKGGPKSFGNDPVAWQREQRKDKPLYGR